jgi:hypothetical protein
VASVKTELEAYSDDFPTTVLMCLAFDTPPPIFKGEG